MQSIKHLLLIKKKQFLNIQKQLNTNTSTKTTKHKTDNNTTINTTNLQTKKTQINQNKLNKHISIAIT